MDNDDARTIAENDQLKEDAYRRYLEWLYRRPEQLAQAADVLEKGPQFVASLPLDTIDFVMDMAAVALRDFSEREIREREEN